MDEAYDIDGRQIRIGDIVEWYYRLEPREVEYTFRVDAIETNNIWGEDIPDQAYYGMDREKNWHSSDWSKVIGRKERKPWEGSTLKFNFI